MSISLLITTIIANTRFRYDEQIELISEFVYLIVDRDSCQNL